MDVRVRINLTESVGSVLIWRPRCSDSSAGRQLGKDTTIALQDQHIIGKDNDTRTGPLYCGFTVKIDNEIVGRSTATTLMHASALDASCPQGREATPRAEALGRASL